MKPITYTVLALIGLGAIAVSFFWTEEVPVATNQAMVQVTVPVLSAEAETGQALFKANCAACHGANAAGNEGKGPPLVHIIYEPGHHGDASFHRAATNGVQAHHWKFGDMPPVEGMNDEKIAAIITYVRELQRANAIQ